MDSAEIIEEISQFYDIKQKVSTYGEIIYYIVCNGVHITVGKCYNGTYCFNFNKGSEGLKLHINKTIRLINDLHEIFTLIYIPDIDHGACDVIHIGNASIFYGGMNGIYISNYPFCKNYDNVYDVIEYLKKSCPECVKSGDIKIALKD